MRPIDSIIEQPANGYFLRDLIIFNGLRSGGYASKGFIFEPPDLDNSQVSELNHFQDQLALLLASLGDNQRLQVQWFCDSNYRRELLRFNEETQRADNTWTRRVRNERFTRYRAAMVGRRLRRQRLVFYISRTIEKSPGLTLTANGLGRQYEHLLNSSNTSFARSSRH